MTVIFMDFPQNLSDHMPEKSDPIAHNGNQNVLVYHTRQNLLNLRQGAYDKCISTLCHYGYQISIEVYTD